ncbi:alpha/beta fold hydrolase [Oceaniserpentilla sp. 4NH20-0058]|uniref:PGAP1-like alpha/beta domain-containing protein n=1 Tax=Oceaniserpentilla sp. 4NH20-0058 TaxID=3127660 RepID=UPI0031050A8F
MIKTFFKPLSVILISLMFVGCGSSDKDNDQKEYEGPLPVLFIHGTSGSASQFQSQAQRFLANGYSKELLYAWEYDSGPLADASVNLDSSEYLTFLFDTTTGEGGFNDQIETQIDEILEATGASQINLMGHSLGTIVSHMFLSRANQEGRVYKYVNLDGYNGRDSASPFGGIETLALWARANSDTALVDEANGVDDYDLNQAHIEIATSATSFAKIYEFFNGVAPETTDILDAETETVTIAGKANIFPDNVGAEDTTLFIYEINADTAARISQTPINTDGFGISSDGSWGPVEISKGAAFEFVLEHGTQENADHYFYLEPFYADDYFVRLNTGRVGEGFSEDLTGNANHSNLVIVRDREFWANVDGGNDVLMVNSENVFAQNELAMDGEGLSAGAQSRRLSSLFLSDQDESGDSSYENIDDVTSVSFIAGMDFFIDATTADTIEIQLTPRGDSGLTQTINVPNRASDEVRIISVQFRDYVQSRNE